MISAVQTSSIINIIQHPLDCSTILTLKASIAPFPYLLGGLGFKYRFTDFFNYEPKGGCDLDCSFGDGAACG